MKKFQIIIAAIVGAASVAATDSSEASYRVYNRAWQSKIVLDTQTLAPLAYTRFCIRYAEECVTPQAAPEPKSEVAINADVYLEMLDLPLTVAASEFIGPPAPAIRSFVSNKEQITEINRTVNRKIAPKPYVGTASFDSWRIAPEAGDCNDYAITKRSLLRQQGWPPERLLLAEVQIPSGEHHLVLVVRLDDEDVVLDNLSWNIRTWSRTPYRWVRVQSPTNGQIWSTLKAPEASFQS